jgi:hypothetical protein
MDQIYEKIEITVGAAGLRYGKRNYPQLLNVIEDFEIGLVVKLKSKLKSIMIKDERKTQMT